MKNKVLDFLIQEKDNLWETLTDYLYFDTTSHYTPLTEEEIQKINELRKEIYDIYKIIDRIGDMI